VKGTAMINYTWNFAQLKDVSDIVAMAEQHFQREIDSVFKPEPAVYARNLDYAVFNQTYYPGSELLTVARNVNNTLLAYTWAKSGDRAAWSDDAMIVIRMVHLDLDLPTKLRVKLIKDMMGQWEELARFTRNPIICSTTMRGDQDGFLKLHAKNGYTVRGSYCYKKIDLL
jgi:hypothetical protein